MKALSDEAKSHMSDMSGQEWGHFLGGVAIGSFVELSTTMEHDNACMRQASAVSQYGFLTYYYYDEFNDPTGESADPRNMIYATFYASKLVEALNGGGCIEFDITVEDILDYLTPSKLRRMPTNLLDPARLIEELVHVFVDDDQDDGSQETEPEKTPNPFSSEDIAMLE